MNTGTLTLSWEQRSLRDDTQRDSEHSPNYKVVVIIDIKPMLKADEKWWYHFLGTELQGPEMSSQNFISKFLYEDFQSNDKLKIALRRTNSFLL